MLSMTRGAYRPSTTRLALFVAASAAALLVGAAPQAHAQAEAGPQVGEVVVTAERRSTKLQSTPLSIIALTSTTLEAKGIENVGDLTKIAPNLSVMGGRTGGNNSPTFTIRGIGGGGGNAGERGVGMYIDGIYVPRTAGSLFKVFDIDRIEVLRGPQGTLFGRNSTGGAIRLFAKQPTHQFDAYVKATVGNFNHGDLIGMINVPLSDTFAVRVQGGSLNEDGYVKSGPQKLGGSKDTVARVQALWDVMPNLKATLGAFYSDSKSDGNPQTLITFDMRPGIEGVVQGNYGDWLNDAFKKSGQAPLAAYNDPRLVKGPYEASGICLIDNFNPDWSPACAQSDNSKYTQYDANIVWTLNDKSSLTLTSGVSKLIHTGVTDTAMIGISMVPDNINSDVLYDELQLNNKLFKDSVDLVVGGNYFHEKSTTSSFRHERRGTSVYSATGGTANGDGDAGLFVTGNSIGAAFSDSYGVFGSGTWHITDKLNLTGGLRWGHDNKAFDNTTFATPATANFPTPAFVPAPGTDRTRVTASHNWSQLDWRGTLDYHFTGDAMAYATVSKAYKAGAYSYTTQQKIPGDLQSGDIITPLPPEQVINYEVGARTTWFDKRLRLNPTLFYMQWTNRQAARNTLCSAADVASGACPAGFRVLLANTGNIDTWGLELDGLLAVTRNFNIDFALGVTDYKLKDPVANGGPNLFPGQASPTGNIGGTYNWALGGRGDVVANISYSYVAAQETYPNSDSDSSYKLPSYGVVNGRITWRSPNRKTSVAVFANNLTDLSYGTFASSFGGGFWDNANGLGVAAPLREAISVVRARPREVGVTLQYNF
jgi:iron complex outermembrane receptor protein